MAHANKFSTALPSARGAPPPRILRTTESNRDQRIADRLPPSLPTYLPPLHPPYLSLSLRIVPTRIAQVALIRGRLGSASSNPSWAARQPSVPDRGACRRRRRAGAGVYWQTSVTSGPRSTSLARRACAVAETWPDEPARRSVSCMKIVTITRQRLSEAAGSGDRFVELHGGGGGGGGLLVKAHAEIMMEGYEREA
jgi:hypothetical protein